MTDKLENVTIYTGDAKSLASFYRKTLGLKLTFEAVMGEDDELYEFKTKNGTLYIIDSNKVKGKNKDPMRFILSFSVENVEKELSRLKSAKVKMIKDIYHIEGYGFVTLMSDPDGNYFELVQTKGKPPAKFLK